MATTVTNPYTGKQLAEAMGDELRSRNNLADVYSASSVLTNLGLTADATELSILDGIGVTVTITAAAGASNVSTIVVTVKDANGATVAAVHQLELFFSADSGGATGNTGTAYSGTLVAGTGVLLETITAKKHFSILTAATGIFSGSLTDSAKTADYACVPRPIDRKVIASAAMAFGA